MGRKFTAASLILACLTGAGIPALLADRDVLARRADLGISPARGVPRPAPRRLLDTASPSYVVKYRVVELPFDGGKRYPHTWDELFKYYGLPESVGFQTICGIYRETDACSDGAPQDERQRLLRRWMDERNAPRKYAGSEIDIVISGKSSRNP